MTFKDFKNIVKTGTILNIHSGSEHFKLLKFICPFPELISNTDYMYLECQKTGEHQCKEKNVGNIHRILCTC